MSRLVLRDFYCLRCKTVTSDVLESATEAILHCRQCGGDRPHVAVCNGGLGARFRYNDFPEDPTFYEGQVETKVEAFQTSEKDGEITGPAKHFETGDAIHLHDRFVGSEAEERKDRHWHSVLTKRGKNRLYFMGRDR